MASNVEENYLRIQAFGDRPLYPYEWLRFHESNRFIGGRELTPYLVEAMAIVPFFSGAKGVVLWGYEPQVKVGDPLPYTQLPLYVASLARIASLSELLGKGQLIIEQPAQALWQSKSPFVRRVEIADRECVVAAINPWQGDDEKSTTTVTCGGKAVPIAMNGRHTTLVDIRDGEALVH